MVIKHIILHLSLIEGIGPVFIKKLIELIGFESLADIYHFSEQDFIRFGLSQQRAHAIVAGLRDQEMLAQELLLIEQAKNIELITFWCFNYPQPLKHIDSAPIVLYAQGDVSLFAHKKILACVGARLSNSYAQDCLNKIVVPLIQNGWIIVSGGALGADTFAHKTALMHGGKTIVVVGSGLCHQYPPVNKPLFEQIVNAGGLIVSSFPMQTEPLPHCFPIRNRIVSGLSVGCLVLQAAVKSGALITAQYALDQGREVFAVPGPIYDPLSAGCHELIKLGAKLVTEPNDILNELLPEFREKEEIQKSFIKENYVELPKKKTEQSVEVVFDQELQLILQHTTTLVSIDELSKKTGLDFEKLQNKLFMLSLDGKIQQDFMGYWKRV